MSDIKDITITEKQLTALEEKVKRGAAAFIEVGQALQKIKDASGFKLRGFETFNDYCVATFNFSERQGYRMISAATDAKKIETTLGEMPRNEAAVRAMKPVMHDPKLVEKVNDRLKKVGQTVATATAEKLQEIVDKVKPKTSPMFEAPKEEKKPTMPTLSDVCPGCNRTPDTYLHLPDGWHCGAEGCNALVMVGVIPANVKACSECGAALIGDDGFCGQCGALVEG